MKQLYKFAIISLLIGFATGALATDSVDPEPAETENVETNINTTVNIAERKSCDDISAEIAQLSAIEEPDSETLITLENLKQKQRSVCNKDAGARAGRSATHMRARAPQSPSRIRPTTDDDDASTPDTASETASQSPCETPDENGCCPGEKYTDIGEPGFKCCPETGDDCVQPVPTSNTSEPITEPDSQPVPDTQPETPTPEQQDVPQPEPESYSDKRIANIEHKLCPDDVKPNKFGCCGDEVFKEIKNLEFGCCLPNDGDCFPPIKQ